MEGQKKYSQTDCQKTIQFYPIYFRRHQELLENIKVSFYKLQANGYFKDMDYRLGCIETIKYFIIKYLNLVFFSSKWPDLKSIVKKERESCFKASG